VKSETDEIDIVKRMSRSVDENQESFFLTINPNMTCNFGCYYCYETHVSKSRISEGTARRVNLLISRIIKEKCPKYLPLAFFGGEPLLYFSKDVVPILNHYIAECRSNGLAPSVGFTTNGYLIGDEFLSYFKRQGVTCGLQITLDGAREKHDTVRFTKSGRGSYDRIVKNIRILVKNQFSVRVRVNYTDTNIEGIEQIADDFGDLEESMRTRFLVFDFHRVWQNERRDDVGAVLESKLERLRTLGIPIASKYAPDNVHNSCYADKRNSAVINYNGDIYKCTARDFTKSSRAGFISDDGDLVWNDEYIERRMTAKFNNPPCLRCRLLPICNGGCSQHALEHLLDGSEYCVYSGDEAEKNRVVISKIQELMQATSS
jgi:uncharacterized protein